MLVFICLYLRVWRGNYSESRSDITHKPVQLNTPNPNPGHSNSPPTLPLSLPSLKSKPIAILLPTISSTYTNLSNLSTAATALFAMDGQNHVNMGLNANMSQHSGGAIGRVSQRFGNGGLGKTSSTSSAS